MPPVAVAAGSIEGETQTGQRTGLRVAGHRESYKSAHSLRYSVSSSPLNVMGLYAPCDVNRSVRYVRFLCTDLMEHDPPSISIVTLYEHYLGHFVLPPTCSPVSSVSVSSITILSARQRLIGQSNLQHP